MTCVKLAPHMLRKWIKVFWFVCASFVHDCAGKMSVCAQTVFKIFNLVTSIDLRLLSTPLTSKWLENGWNRLCTIVQAKLTFLHKPFLYYLTFNFLKVGDASPANIQITQKCLDLFMLCLCMLVWVKLMFVHKPFLSYFVFFCYFIYII